ncbi:MULTISPECIES: hypothetical protein [Pseudoalteromonas]|uniref:hypothetical protein n=1 Tax=Pseudoalteromonas TaxID=53246 RepID=UPI0030027FBC|tara:strand:+ start:316 stop:600 length:285 start_codon:yes stop_codon:yes gene_type:complete
MNSGDIGLTIVSTFMFLFSCVWTALAWGFSVHEVKQQQSSKIHMAAKISWYGMFLVHVFLLFSLWFYSFSKGSLFLTLLTSHISFYLFFVKNLK